MNVTFNDDIFMEINREAGHLLLNVPIVRENGSESDSIYFILDSGAYITVISRYTAIRYGYDRLPAKRASLNGFCGREPADLIEIPALRIADRLLTGVKVLVPVSFETTQEVLGQNVLEYFNYYLDTANNRIYFSINPSPNPYINKEKNIDMSCTGVFVINDNSVKLNELSGESNLFAEKFRGKS